MNTQIRMDQIQDDCIDPSTTIIVTAAIITIVNSTSRGNPAQFTISNA